MEHFRTPASATSRPFIYLSAGSSDEVFCEMLELVAKAGVKYSGVLCGRATWQDAISVYANEGVAALEGWLADRGLKKIQALNNVLARGAVPWWDVCGGKDNIEIIECAISAYTRPNLERACSPQPTTCPRPPP